MTIIQSIPKVIEASTIYVHSFLPVFFHGLHNTEALEVSWHYIMSECNLLIQ